jgi:hypothetical protein
LRLRNPQKSKKACIVGAVACGLPTVFAGGLEKLIGKARLICNPSRNFRDLCSQQGPV